MQLSYAGFAALRFSLALAVILLLSPNTFAQHSGGGGSASAGSSGGGSHGGSSGGGSASSGGGHSSGGGSSSHSSGSASHGSTAHSSSSGSAASHSGTTHPSASHSNTASKNLHSVHAPSTGSSGKAQPPQKHGFFSFLPFLRHHVPVPLPNPPQPKPEPKEPVAELRHPICFRGPCTVCPAGQVHGANGCGGNIIQNRIERRCPAGESWTGGGCLLQTWYQDECGGLRTMMERQAQRTHAAQLDRQITCSIGPWQQCSDLTSSAESEAGFYQALQNRYQACQRRSPTALPHLRFRVPGYSGESSFHSLSFELGPH